MKRFLKLFLSVGMILAMACTPEEHTDPLFRITSASEMQFAAEGGAGEITYTLENPTGGTEITVTNNADWITDITVGETITFTVAPNDNNMERSERLTVAYGQEKHFVSINQKGVELVAEEEMSMVYMISYFYDKDLSMEKIHQYFVALCDEVCEKTDEYIAVPRGAYYCQFYICSNISAQESNNKIPNGTYILDEERSLNHGTIDHYNSHVFGRDQIRLEYEEAIMTVSDNHIEVTFKTEDGKVIKATYNGSLDITPF